MGLVLPMLFQPANVLGALVFSGFAFSGWKKTSKGYGTGLAVASALFGLPGVLFAMIAFDYLGRGHYVDDAQSILTTFGIMAVPWAAATWVWMRDL